MPAITQPEVDVLYAQLQRRLVETGEWDRICLLLKYRLNDEGWIDLIGGQSREHARAMDQLSIRDLLAGLKDASGSIPPSVRKEVTTIIRQALEKHLE